MKTIEVLGPGCAKCGRLEIGVREVVVELGLDAEVRKVTDLDEMLAHDVFTTPALVIDGRVVVAGRVPSRAELRTLLEE
jgi:small redox-active disulfide protein 2